jgi:hypothetical protein
MRTGHSIRNTLLILAAIFLCWSGGGADRAHATETGEADIYVLYEDFTWKEFGSAGNRLLKEHGPLVGFGAAYAAWLPGNLTLKPRGELFFGQVDYDGQTQVGTPVMTDTSYGGIKLEADLGAKIGDEFSIEPFGGLALRTWWRDIDDSIDIFGDPVVGYTENWTTFYARLGIRGDRPLSPSSRMFFEVAAKLPLYNQNVAYLSDIGFTDDVILEPGRRTSFFAEVGFKVQACKMSAFYESMRFSESDMDFTFDLFTGTLVGFVQPRSEADIYGLRIGASF